MVAVHISKHSLFRLKITVGCRLCAYPSIHFSLDEDTLKITVGCRLCCERAAQAIAANVVVSAYAPRAAAASFSLKSSDMTLAAESKTAAGGCAEASIVSTPASLDGPNK